MKESCRAEVVIRVGITARTTANQGRSKGRKAERQKGRYAERMVPGNEGRGL